MYTVAYLNYPENTELVSALATATCAGLIIIIFVRSSCQGETIGVVFMMVGISVVVLIKEEWLGVESCTPRSRTLVSGSLLDVEWVLLK
jgi:hypothetical protein